MGDYFSDRENGLRERIDQVISPTVWAGVVAMVQGLINSASFGLGFDQQVGQDEFRASINSLFARNDVAYEMLPTGQIARVLPPVLGEELRRTTFNTGDRTCSIGRSR